MKIESFCIKCRKKVFCNSRDTIVKFMLNGKLFVMHYEKYNCPECGEPLLAHNSYKNYENYVRALKEAGITKCDEIDDIVFDHVEAV